MYEFNALTAKCRCMSAGLLDEEKYTVLAGTPSLGEAARYLMESTSYASVMRETEPATVNRERLESLIEKSRFDAYEKLYKFTSGAARSLITVLMGEIELSCLLSEIFANFTQKKDNDGGNNGDGGDYNRASIPSRIRHRSEINFSALSEANGEYGKIILACEGSRRYGAIIKRRLMGEEFHRREPPHSAEPREDGGLPVGGDYAGLETALMDRYYTECVRAVIKNLDHTNGAAIRDYLLAKVDFMNAERIIRIKRFARASGLAEAETGQALSELLTLHGKIGKSEAAAMLRLHSTADVLEYCSRLYPRGESIFMRGIITERSGSESSVGDYYSRFLYNYAIKNAHTNQAPLLSVVCFLARKRIETENVIYIIDATRYGITPHEIMRNIIN